MYVRLRGARVFPSDATQIPSLATPSSCTSNPILASKFSLGLFFFFFLVTISELWRQSGRRWAARSEGGAGGVAGEGEAAPSGSPCCSL